MKLFLIIIALIGFQQSELALKGIVMSEKDAAPGVVVKIKGTANQVVTNLYGEFSIPIQQDSDSLTLEITWFDKATGPTTEIANIRHKGQTVDLGKLQVFLNKSIEIEEYEKLNEAAKVDYQPVHHWTQLIGYTHKSRIDTANLLVYCSYNLNKNVDYKYNQSDNRLTIDYADLEKCK